MADLRETGLTLDPKFDAHGLVTAVCTDADSGQVLMVAHMNAEALAQTLRSMNVAPDLDVKAQIAAKAVPAATESF